MQLPLKSKKVEMKQMQVVNLKNSCECGFNTMRPRWSKGNFQTPLGEKSKQEPEERDPKNP